MQLILDCIKFRHERKQVLIVYAIMAVVAVYFLFFLKLSLKRFVLKTIIQTFPLPNQIQFANLGHYNSTLDLTGKD